MELVRRKNKGYYERFQDMNLVAPCDRELEAQILGRIHKTVSPLQDYVTARLADEQRFFGEMRSDWLDGQQIDQAARACEMLGACRTFGAHTDLDKLSLAQWDEAGAAGFEAAGGGSTGIRQALHEISVRSLREKGAGGPQAAFGRLYQWMQFNKSNQDRGPIMDVVREHILDTFPVEPGTLLFGMPVTKRRRHTAPTLSKSTGIHYKTIKHALVGAGLLPEDSDARNERVAFDADAGEKLARRIQNSVPVTKIPAYLNCNRTQAQMLVKNGILPQLVQGLGRSGGVLKNVATDDLDDFLARFRMRGQPVRFAGENMLDVIAASEIARQTVTDIVRLVLDGRLSRVETLTEDLRFRSVLVDPEEIKAVAGNIEEEIGYSAQDVGKRLGILPSGTNCLRKTLDRDGQPFLSAIEITNARGTVRYRFAEEAISQFEQAHVSLPELSKERGQSSRAVSRELKEVGIEPIIRRELLGASIYRRTEL